MTVHGHTVMLRIANRHVKKYYKSKAHFCDVHGIDRGNFSRAMNGKGVMTAEMLEPLGLEKEYVPMYKTVPTAGDS
tara:strand:+ start:19837 stop:20064 length:228 start_codon:yes stop_codon:yes gene_type:complete